MNAAAHFAGLLPPETVRRLAGLRVPRTGPVAPPPGRGLDAEGARAHVVARWGGDLCGLLNAMTRGELEALARAVGAVVESAGRVESGALRAALWARGAALERGGAVVSHAVQPVPVLLGGHLVVQAPPRGPYPAASMWPRPVPPPAPARPPAEEPDNLDELLAAADRALGVRLGPRGRDKGAWGARAAALLGVVERGADEPDWRGDVEVKTVPIARDRSGLWRIVEDPAIAMQNEANALAKLQHTLWLARTDLEGDATLVSWYLLPWDAEVARLASRYLHDRPKGPAGTDQRGLYLSKRFFAEAGLLATLNGAAP